ncbi:MAG: hypothetical protein NC321_05625 [Clostridium sp.]|nr:hypothetical protein [Clostridium sp.]
MKTTLYQQADASLEQPRILLQFPETLPVCAKTSARCEKHISDKTHTTESEKCVEDVRALLHHALSEHLKKSKQLNTADRSPETERLNKGERI